MEARQQRWFDDFAAFAAVRRERRSAAGDVASLRAQIGAGEQGGKA
jgi:hypothetical protein